MAAGWVRGALVLGALASASAGLCLVWAFRGRPAALPAPAAISTASMGGIPEVVYGCGSCHTLPPPLILPKARWPETIRMMNERVAAFALGPPMTASQIEEVTRYYVGAAPEKLPELRQNFAPSPIRLTPSVFGRPPAPQAGQRPPAVGHINIVDLDQDGRPDVLICDTAGNHVSWAAAPQGSWIEVPLAQVEAPAHAEVADVMGLGRPQVVVAVLGTLTPTEDPVGGVVVMSNDGRGRLTVDKVLSDAPRVSDARPVDIDGDGDMDIVVAAYGMYKTGGVMLLEQTERGRFAPRTLKQINGVSFVPVADINGDGKPDIVALVSQQHEQVVALVNLGGGRFEERLLWQGPHPQFGCASIELVDLDRDGDIDVLFANGDALDFDTAPKPYHGVQWLENKGGLRFEYHDIARFYGAYRAAAGDLDRDGDLDIVVTSMGNRWEGSEAQAIIWLENDGKQKFTPRAISASPTYQVTAQIGDLNGDGWPDILTAGMYLPSTPGPFRVGRVTLWTNGGRVP